MGNHHLEYGFPSTHTTNCASAALYMFLLLRSSTVAASPTIFYPAVAALGIYAISVTFGRIYCGMHSITDCVFGVFMGCSITLFWWRFGDFIVESVATGGWQIPVLTTFAWALMINQHPQPVDDCPCFEDAIAFVSVLAGMFITIWHARWMAVDQVGPFLIPVISSSKSATGQQLLHSPYARISASLTARCPRFCFYFAAQDCIRCICCICVSIGSETDVAANSATHIQIALHGLQSTPATVVHPGNRIRESTR
jgi:hypothetical protein